MNVIIWTLLLAIAWTAITTNLTIGNFALGMALGFLALMFARHVPGPRHYLRLAYAVLALLAYTLWEIMLANLRVTRDILRPHNVRPALLSFETRARGDIELTLLTALITITPGTTVVDISEDATHLFVHFTNLPPGGPDQARREIRAGFERRLLEVLR